MSDDDTSADHAHEHDDPYHRRLWERGDLTLRFPADSVGDLQIDPVGDGDESVVVPAQGVLTVPAGHMAALECSDEEPAGNLEWLDGLPADGLAGFAAMGVSAAGLRRLADQRELFQVVLERPEPDDTALAALGALPELEILAVDDDRSDGAWLGALAATSLMMLELHRAETGAAALQGIGSVGGLLNLTLVSARIDAAALRHLGTLGELESLTIWTDTPLTAADLAFCADLPHLEILELKRADGTDALTGAERLALLRALPDVDVNGLWYPPEKLAAMTAADLDDLDSAAVRVVDDEGALERLLAERRPVLLYFTAAWCGPCKQFGPLVDRYAADNTDRLTVAKVDIDVAPDLADRFDIQGVPTLVMMDRDEVTGTTSGAMPRRDLSAFVDELLAR